MSKELKETLDSIESKLSKENDDNSIIITSLKEEFSGFKQQVTEDNLDNKTLLKQYKDKIENLEAKITNGISVGNKSVNTSLFTKNEDNPSIYSVDFRIIKTYSVNDNVAGSPASSNEPYHIMPQGNVFRNLATILPIYGGVYKLPTVGGITFAAESSNNASRTVGGTLTSANVVVKAYASESAYSISSLEEVPSMDSAIVSLIATEAGKAEALDAVTALKAGGYTVVTTGVAAALPTTANIVGKMAAVLAGVDPAYRMGAMFVISNALYSLLLSANNNGLNFDPAMGINTLFGYPLQVVSYLDAGGTAGDKSAFFGDFSRGLIIGVGSDLTIGRYAETRPGLLTYFAQFRGKANAWDVNALSTLETKV